MNARAARTYSSPLRAEQAEQTRDRIVQAAVELLSAGEPGDLSMNDVAARAGVSVRTVYRHFATRDDLLGGILGWISERIAQRTGRPGPPSTRAEWIDLTPDVVDAVFDAEPLYRALFATRAGRETHRRRSGRREEMVVPFAEELDALSAEQRERFAGLVHLVSSSNAALFLKDYWDLSPDDVGRALQWAIVTLADAARDPKRRSGL